MKRLAIPSTVLLGVCLSVLALMPGGCARPSKANIELRKQKQTLEEQIQKLKRDREADAATIRGLESRAGTLPLLPQDRLARLFTVYGLQFGRLTGGADLDPKQAGDEGLKVYVVPLDETGQPLKAAGSFTVEAFDLADPRAPLIGKWIFPVEQARQNWYGLASLYTYVLTCPWQQKIPTHVELTVKVRFVDELTGRVFEAERVAKITPSTVPATAPAAQ